MLERLGAWRGFWENGPAIIRRLILHFGPNETSCNLREQAFGLSRYRFDHLLFNRAVTLGGGVIAASAETAWRQGSRWTFHIPLCGPKQEG